MQKMYVLFALKYCCSVTFVSLVIISRSWHSLLFQLTTEFSYKYINDLKVVVLYFPNFLLDNYNSLIIQKNLRNEYSDNSVRRLERAFCPMRVHMSCTTTLHAAVKAENVCRLRHHYMHFTSQRFAVGIHIPLRRVVLEVGFSRPCGKAFTWNLKSI